MKEIIPVILALIFLIIIIYFGWRKGNNPEVNEGLENDAKRFARLLMAEIKLYETYKLQRGLKYNSLYESLSDEIAEARKKYIKRCPGKNLEIYFENALIDILADGDKGKLGVVGSSLN